MDGFRFDALTRALAAPKSRRGFLTGLGGVLLGARAASAQEVCPPGQSPNRKGDCSCPAGTDACPAGCFDLKRDLANCGRCGRTCLGGTCVKGECRCPAGTELCDGACTSGPCCTPPCPECMTCTGTVCTPDSSAAGTPCGDGTMICCFDGSCGPECT